MNKILPEKETFYWIDGFLYFQCICILYAYIVYGSHSHINLAQKGDQPLSSEEAAQNKQYL